MINDQRYKMDDKGCIAAAIIVFQQIENHLEAIGQNMLDNGVSYNIIKRLQNIDLKFEDLINYMRGELK